MSEVVNVHYSTKQDAKVEFHNQVDYCVGTGRAGLALQKEYFDQLEFVQENIGFKHIRGHGLFTDDMAIYHRYTDENGNEKSEYNFTYLDLVMDSYRKVGLKPFLELGFMPEKMASGTQTVFYWKGNVTPPKKYSEWCALVQAVLRHLMERYGEEEVLTWPIEVWNEPNLPGFWKDADMEEYFKLFKESFYAIKEVNEKFRVGGPAICGVRDEEWIRKFMEFCRENKIPVDFITRHHYTTELPEKDGHYEYQELTVPEYGKANLHTTREIVDSFEEYRGKEIQNSILHMYQTIQFMIQTSMQHILHTSFHGLEMIMSHILTGHLVIYLKKRESHLLHSTEDLVWLPTELFQNLHSGPLRSSRSFRVSVF